MAIAHLTATVDRIKSMHHTAVAAMSAGEVSVVNGRVTLAYADAAIGEDLQLIYQAEQVNMPKAAEALSPGDVVYWDDSAENVTATDTGNTKCGMVRKAAVSGDAEVSIELVNVI